MKCGARMVFWHESKQRPPEAAAAWAVVARRSVAAAAAAAATTNPGAGDRDAGDDHGARITVAKSASVPFLSLLSLAAGACVFAMRAGIELPLQRLAGLVGGISQPAGTEEWEGKEKARG